VLVPISLAFIRRALPRFDATSAGRASNSAALLIAFAVLAVLAVLAVGASACSSGKQAQPNAEDLTARFNDDFALFYRNRSQIEYQDMTVDGHGTTGQADVTWYKSGLDKQRVDATLRSGNRDPRVFSLILGASDLQYICLPATPQVISACSNGDNDRDVGYLFLLVLGLPVVPDAVQDLRVTATDQQRIVNRDATCYHFESASQPGKDSGTACFGAGLLLRFSQHLDANDYSFDLTATGVDDAPADIAFAPPYPLSTNSVPPTATSP
jgi:hypothetical protein